MRVVAEEVVELVLAASQRVMEDLPAEHRRTFTPASALIGGDSPLDSLALVGLVIEVQESVRSRFGVTVVLADEQALAEPVNPFSTVDSLAGYVRRLLESSD